MLKLLIFLFLSSSLISSKRSAIFFFKKPDLQFNINFVNVSWDLSSLAAVTKERPIEIIPEFYGVVMKDWKLIQGSIQTFNYKTGQISTNINANICSLTKNFITGFFARPITEMALKSANFSIKCPFKKGTVLYFDNMNVKSLPMSSLFPKNIERKLSIILKTGKDLNPFISVMFYFMRIEIDE
ncbi:hypothetical protein PVAND_015639 [Polypedilum vanderplanki]|uniref:Uncharacterized protein n=1 Tax=Polypedilum vanderplanki TaxID=319348 RepID=A0A9J6BD89_POLVA|nr:hypothetical protein PVAND_015639 [Polypedilum vanderplanki]